MLNDEILSVFLRERVMRPKTKKIRRINLEGADFKETIAQIGQSFTYTVDLEQKVVKISLTDALERKGTISKKNKTKQVLDGKTSVEVPVLDIKNKLIQSVLNGCSELKLQIFEDGFIITPHEPTTTNAQTTCASLLGKIRYTALKQKFSLQFFAKTKVMSSEEQLSLFDLGYSLSEDETTQRLARTTCFKQEESRLAKVLKTLTLFSGIGAPEMALRNLGIKTEIIGTAEIDVDAIISYHAIHHTSETDFLFPSKEKMVTELEEANVGYDIKKQEVVLPKKLDRLKQLYRAHIENRNWGDITRVNFEKLPKIVDLLIHGSPCTNYSTAGDNSGGDEGSGTRSSLMWNAVSIIKKCLPTYVLWENVTGVLTKKHKHNYDKYLSSLREMGYTNHNAVLDAKEFGLPQQRRRVFVLSILNGAQAFQFPTPIPLVKRLKDVCADCLQDIPLYKKSFKAIAPLDFSTQYDNPHVIAIEPYSKDPNKVHQSNSIYHPNGVAPTLSQRDFKGAPMIAIPDATSTCDFVVKRLSPKIHWRLMGFSDVDYEKAAAVCSPTQLYRQAGNSIALPVLEAIFSQLFKTMPLLHN